MGLIAPPDVHVVHRCTQFIEKMAEKAMGQGQQNQGGPPGGYPRPQEVRSTFEYDGTAAARD